MSKHSALFGPGLGTIKEVEAKLYVQESTKPRFSRAIYAKVEAEIDCQAAEEILTNLVKFSE